MVLAYQAAPGKGNRAELRKGAVTFFLPQVLKEDRTPQGRKIRSVIPLFPSYLFLLGDSNDRLIALRGNRLVSVLEVSDQKSLERDLRQIHTMLSSGLPVQPEPAVPVGSRVRITTGPLTGIEGTVTGAGNTISSWQSFASWAGERPWTFRTGKSSRLPIQVHRRDHSAVVHSVPGGREFTGSQVIRRAGDAGNAPKIQSRQPKFLTSGAGTESPGCLGESTRLFEACGRIVTVSGNPQKMDARPFACGGQTPFIHLKMLTAFEGVDGQ